MVLCSPNFRVCINAFFLSQNSVENYVNKKALKFTYLRQISAYHHQSKSQRIDLQKGKKIDLYLNKEWLNKMSNGTEEVCLLENWNHDNSVIDTNSEQQLMLQDPYDSIWLKIIAILSYLIGLVTSVIMNAFVNYENGHHGNFRTLINQLLSILYDVVS